MAKTPFIITRKLYDLEKKLSGHVLSGTSGYKPIEVENKLAAFDLIFSLSIEDQEHLFKYRAFRARVCRQTWSKYDIDQLEALARFLGHKDLNELELESMRERWDDEKRDIDPNKKVDTGRMVSDFIATGQQGDEGRTLKRHLDQVLNNEVSERVKIIN
jgi:hypothetical protein